jgi:rRNA maturation RNase YbeY
MYSKSVSKVNFFFDGRKINLRNRKRLKSFIESIFINEKKGLEAINYIFTTDKILLEVNKTYLNHHFLTDILTFDLSSPKKPKLADVYISVDRVKENAQNLRTGYNSELHRVIFHGALHLCGYNDRTIKQKNIMRKMEDHYLIKYFK